MMSFTWNNQELETDAEGFLKNNFLWDVDLAAAMALSEGVTLTKQHWTLMHYLREYYEIYDIAPPMRMMVKIMANEYGKDQINSRVLQQLFPKGPAKQGSRFAGLPKPKNCL